MILALLLSVVLSGCDYYQCKRECGAHSSCSSYCNQKCNRSVEVDAFPSARSAGWQKACQQHDDCLTGNCYNGKCAAPRRGRGAGMYEECEQDSDCNSGLMCNRHDECVLDGRSVEEGKLARGMKCCDGSGCHNYPFGAYFTCQNNGGTVSGRSVDSEEEKLARGKVQDWGACEADSDCESGRCRRDWDDWECHPARSVDSEREARYSGNSSGNKFQGPNRSGTKFRGRRME